MTRDEFLELINNYGLKVTHSAITCEDGYVIDFALDEVQTRRASMIPSYDWEQFDFKSKMAIVDVTNVPLGQIPGEYKYSGGTLRFAGSFEYMWGMIVQIFKGMEKQPTKSSFDETLRKTYQFNKGRNVEGLEDLELQYGFNFIETIRSTLSPETKEAIMSLHQKNEAGEVRGVKLRLLARMLKEAIIHANEKSSIDSLMKQMLREGKLLEGEDMTELQNDIAF